MQAIVTKYHGPGNTRGSRFSATAEAGRIYVAYDHALDIEENHVAAARAFAEKFGWIKGCELVSGALPRDAGYCHVLVVAEAMLDHRLPNLARAVIALCDEDDAAEEDGDRIALETHAALVDDARTLATIVLAGVHNEPAKNEETP